MRTTWSFHSAGTLVFGSGAVNQLGDQVARLGAASAVIITDEPLVAVGAVDRLLDSLRAARISATVFAEGEPEPSLDVARRAFEFSQRQNPAAVIGLGGGSNMDVAKMTALLLAHGGQPKDYFGFDHVPGPVLPLVCVPTTAGTGSEVSHSAVLTDTAQGMKVSSLSNWLRPRVALVDPDLTLTCPRRVTAESGIDALTHALEACTAVDSREFDLPPGEKYAYQGAFPLGVALAEQAVRLIGRHLARAVQFPDDREAREGMSLAATLAGLAFSNCGVALVHALEYPLGAALHCSHGAGNGLLLPHVLRFNLPVRQATLARIAEWLGCATGNLSEEEAARQAIAAVEQLARTIGIPSRLRDLGARSESLPEFAAKAFAIKRLLRINPRAASESDLLDILQAAF